jgi:hypothetical protein
LSAETAGENRLSTTTRSLAINSTDSGIEFQKPLKYPCFFITIHIENNGSNSPLLISPISQIALKPLAWAASARSNKPVVGSLTIATLAAWTGPTTPPALCLIGPSTLNKLGVVTVGVYIVSIGEITQLFSGGDAQATVALDM